MLVTQRTVEGKTEAVVVDSLPLWFEALDDFAEKLAAIKVLLRRTECVGCIPSRFSRCC